MFLKRNMVILLTLTFCLVGCGNTNSKATVNMPSTTTDTPQPSPTEYVEPTETSDNEIIVYVTDTGEKYHRASCYHLQRSKREVTLTEAKNRHRPCAACDPPR